MPFRCTALVGPVSSALVLAALASTFGACRDEAPETTRDEPAAVSDDAEAIEAKRRREAIAALTRWEESQRAATDFATVAPWSEAAGADPFRIFARPGGAIGLLRGLGRIVTLDPSGAIVGTPVETFVDATGWDLSATQSTLYVVGPRQGSIARYRRDGDTWLAASPLTVADTWSLRDVAVGPSERLALSDPYSHRVLVVDTSGDAETTAPRFAAACGGPLSVRWTSTRLLALCSIDHALLAWRLGEDGLPQGEPARIEHDGPMWSFDVLEHGDTALVAIGGVEDHALDRSDGSFGNVDSFVFVTEFPASGAPRRRAALNVSAHGALVPKWVRLSQDDDATVVDVVGYGGDRHVHARWDASFAEPEITTRTVVPGITDVAIMPDGTWLAASPLLDAFVRSRPTAIDPTVLPVPNPDDQRTAEVKLGEALAFTGLMAPAAHTEGKASRFTCETCHFEGGVDGRVHWTGRGEVHAATRSLRGLFNNRPHFSRALDATMAKMVDNEFRVASRGTGADPWFTLDLEANAWVRHLGVTEPVDGTGLRRALMAFIMTFSPEPNPRALTAQHDDAEIEAGAVLFEQLCEGCHEARLVSDDPSSRVERARWMSLIGSPAGPIVWGTGQRKQTGVEPYVHEEGARVPSLRRLYAKRPYFTNGSTGQLLEAAARFSVGTEQHVRDAAGGRNITEDERRALARFLELL